MDRPVAMPPVFYRNGKQRRIVPQVWDWLDDRRYIVHIFITRETDDRWETRHFNGLYRAVSPDEVARLALQAGFNDCRILSPQDTGYYQPIVRGVSP